MTHGQILRATNSSLFLGLCFAVLLLPAAAVESDPQAEAALTLDEALTAGDLSDERTATLRETFAQATPAELAALEYLLREMPARDLDNLDPATLHENIVYACRVRQEVPWSA